MYLPSSPKPPNLQFKKGSSRQNGRGKGQVAHLSRPKAWSSRHFRVCSSFLGKLSLEAGFEGEEESDAAKMLGIHNSRHWESAQEQECKPFRKWGPLGWHRVVLVEDKRDMAENDGGEIMGTKGGHGEIWRSDKKLIQDTGMHWKPVEGYAITSCISLFMWEARASSTRSIKPSASRITMAFTSSQWQVQCCDYHARVCICWFKISFFICLLWLMWTLFKTLVCRNRTAVFLASCGQLPEWVSSGFFAAHISGPRE